MRIIRFGTVLLSALMMLVSCDQLAGFVTPGTGGGNNEANNEENKVTPTLQPDEQKLKLEEVALQLMDKCPADDFENFVNLSEDFTKTYLDNGEYDFSAFETYVEDVNKVSVQEQKWIEKFDEAKKEYIKERITNLTIVLSNYTGSFEFKKNGVEKLAGNHDGLKVTFPLGSKTYVAEIVPSSKVSRATFEYVEKSYWTETRWDYIEKEVHDEYGNVWYEYEDVLLGNYLHYNDFLLKFAMDVPENIKIALTENGKSVADINIDITQSYSAAGLNPTVDNFSAKTTVTLNNGYCLEIGNASFDGAASKAGYSMSLKKDGEALIKSSASADFSFDVMTYKYDHGSGDYISRGEYTWVEVTKGKNISATADILGQIQVKGSCSNAMELVDIMDSFYEAAELEDKTKMDRAMNNINSKLDIGVYYDEGSNRQASVEFEYEKDVYYWDDQNEYYDYDIIPIIVFEDNSRYTIDDYFTEKAFSSLIDKFETFGEKYSELFGTIVKEEIDVPYPQGVR